MLETLRAFVTSSFAPHGSCYQWRSELIMLHAISDGMIAAAYFAIPLALIWFVRKRSDLAFSWMFVMFSLFILLCGVTHVASIWTIWNATYWLSGGLKAITGVVSLATAVLLIPLIPRAIALPSPSQYRSMNDDLVAQVAARMEAEEQLRQMNDELEVRVAHRTAEIEALLANAPVGFATFDRDLKCVRVNAMLAALTRHSVGEAIGEDISTLAPGEPERVSNLIRSVLNEGSRRQIEICVLDDSGARFFLVNGFPIRVADEVVLTGVVFTEITDQKRAEQVAQEREAIFAELNEELETKNQQLQGLFDHSPAGLAFFEADEPFRIRAHNTVFEHYWNPSRSGGDLVGRGLTDLLPEVQDEGLVDVFRKVAREREGITLYKYPVDGPLREPRWWNWNLSPIITDGRLTGFSQLFVDVTHEVEIEQQIEERRAELARIEQTLAEREREFTLMADTIPQLAWMGDENGYIFWYNRRWYEFTGTALDDVAGWNWMSVHHPDHLDRVVDGFKAAIEKGEPWEDTFPLRRFDGMYRWFLTRARPFRDETGTVVRWFGTNTDVTEQLQMEQALRQSESSFRKLADAMPQCVWVADVEGSTTYFNERWYQYTGQDKRDAEGFGWLDAIHPEDQAEAREVWERSVASQQLYEAYVRLRRFDGEHRWHLVRGLPVLNEMDQTVQWFGTYTDIHDQVMVEEELKKAMEQAEEANRMKSVFLANMSHEIRTPLTAILGFAELIQRMSEGRVEDFADRIAKGGKRLSETLDSVLTLARLEAGRIDIITEPIPIASELRDLVELHRNAAKKKGLSFTVSIERGAEDIALDLDRGAFNSVIQNLVSNAIKFADQGFVEVALRLDERERIARISVEDSGIGIAEEAQETIFEPFTQESSGRARTHEGAGLGLSIARQLVEKMNGTIILRSEKGRGSRFEVSFPYDPASTIVSRGGGSDTSVRMHDTMRILVVDDHEDTRTLVMSVLQDEHEVILCSSATEAIRVLGDSHKTGQIDLALLDVNLGGEGGGLDILAHIRSAGKYRDLPVAAVTAYALPGDRERFLEAGFDLYLRKPFSADELKEIVRALAGRAGTNRDDPDPLA
jgi:PAS domain S-box-containing protein